MTNQYPKTIEDAALLLDEVKPNWYEKIDIHKLDLKMGYACILGQIYGKVSTSYRQGMQDLFGVYIDNNFPQRDSIFGTTASKEKWVKQIELRKEGKVPPMSEIGYEEKPSIQITVPKSIIENMVLTYVRQISSIERIKLENLDPVIKQDYDNAPEFEGYKATVFVG